MFCMGVLGSWNERIVFIQLYKAYRQPMMKAAMEILGDLHLAQDAVQEAFLNVMKHVDKIQKLDERHRRGYMLLASRNRARDICRRRKNLVYLEDVQPLLLEQPRESAGLPVLEKIPEPYREALALTGMQYTPAEIAEITGENIWTIYKRIQRGKELLQKKLHEEGRNEY